MSLSSIYSFNASPNLLVGTSEKESSLAAIAHLLAKYLDILPLFFYPALPIKVELNINPYLGVLPLVLRALNKAFSAPNIYIVEAGYLARLVSPPEWDISLDPTISPIREVKLGATAFILCLKYSDKLSLNVIRVSTLAEKSLIYASSASFIGYPIESLAASIIYYALSSSWSISTRSSFISSLTFSLFSIKCTNLV